MATHAAIPSAQALGLLDHEFLTGIRIIPFLDFVNLVLRVPQPLQSSQIFRHFPAVWRQKERGGNRVKSTLAAHIPGARRPSQNTCDHFTLTIHEPHSWGFCLADLRKFLDAIPGAQLCPQFDTVEWGLDLWMDGSTRECIDKDPGAKQAYLRLFGDFAACAVSRFKRPMGIAASTTRTFIPATAAQLKRQPEVKGAIELIDSGGHGFACAIADMQTGYIGNAPEWKDWAGIWHWRDSIQLRAYYKTTDGGTSLPTDQHRPRIELTAACRPSAGEDSYIDPIALLAGSTSAANRIASFLATEVPIDKLSALMKQRLGLSVAARGEAAPDEAAASRPQGKKSDRYDAPCAPATVGALNGKTWTVAQDLNKLKRQGHKRQKAAADPWNQTIVDGFVAMARRMKRAQKGVVLGPASSS